MVSSRLVVALSILALGCSQGSRDAAEGSDAATATAEASLRNQADEELIQHVRELGEVLVGDTIHIYSPGWSESTDPMSGTELDRKHYGFFRPFYSAMTGSKELYAVGYTRIGPGFTAYVLRVPSKYAPTAIALWIYNEQEKYWLAPRVVADGFGDADWWFRQDAWLVDRNRDGFMDLVTRRTDWLLEWDSVYRDSLTWRFWQSSFGKWGWERDLSDSAEANVFTIPPRQY